MHSVDDQKLFYEEWASRELEDNQRQAILEWKADEMVRMIGANNRVKIDSIMELGCAEGTVLNRLGAGLDVQNLYGVDLSQKFISIGQQRYPHINFLNESWEKIVSQEQSADLLVVSDFIEHLPGPDSFLEKIKHLATYFIFKIPLEKAWLPSLYKAFGRWPEIGPDHPSGHLHEYDEFKALTLIEGHGYKILQSESLVTPFEFNDDVKKWYTHPSLVVQKLANLFPMNWQIRLIGGSLFVLGAYLED